MLEPSLYRWRHTVLDVSCRVRLSTVVDFEIQKPSLTLWLNKHCYEATRPGVVTLFQYFVMK